MAQLYGHRHDTDTSITGHVLSSTSTSDSIVSAGFNGLQLAVSFTHVSATDLSFQLQGSHDGTNFHICQRSPILVSLGTSCIEAGVPGATATTATISSSAGALTDVELTKAVSGDIDFMFAFPITSGWVRVVTSATAATSDTIDINFRLVNNSPFMAYFY